MAIGSTLFLSHFQFEFSSCADCHELALLEESVLLLRLGVRWLYSLLQATPLPLLPFFVCLQSYSSLSLYWRLQSSSFMDLQREVRPTQLCKEWRCSLVTFQTQTRLLRFHGLTCIHYVVDSKWTLHYVSFLAHPTILTSKPHASFNSTQVAPQLWSRAFTLDNSLQDSTHAYWFKIIIPVHFRANRVCCCFLSRWIYLFFQMHKAGNDRVCYIHFGWCIVFPGRPPCYFVVSGMGLWSGAGMGLWSGAGMCWKWQDLHSVCKFALGRAGRRAHI